VDVVSGEVRPITQNEVDDWAPSWSPSGDKIAFASGRFPNNCICVMAPDGGELVALTPCTGYHGAPKWSPDGSLIAYYQEVTPGNTDIFVMDGVGGNARRLTSHSQPDEFPVWSPDGRYLAFASLRAGGYADVYTLCVASPFDSVISVSPAPRGWDCPGAWIADSPTPAP
jgi:TolB protein